MHQLKTWRIHALFAVLLLLCTSLTQAQNKGTDTAELEQRIQQSQDSIRAMVEVQPEQLSQFLDEIEAIKDCLLYTSPSPRDGLLSRMPSSA